MVGFSAGWQPQGKEPGALCAWLHPHRSPGTPRSGGRTSLAYHRPQVTPTALLEGAPPGSRAGTVGSDCSVQRRTLVCTGCSFTLQTPTSLGSVNCKNRENQRFRDLMNNRARTWAQSCAPVLTSWVSDHSPPSTTISPQHSPINNHSNNHTPHQQPITVNAQVYPPHPPAPRPQTPFCLPLAIRAVEAAGWMAIREGVVDKGKRGKSGGSTQGPGKLF